MNRLKNPSSSTPLKPGKQRELLKGNESPIEMTTDSPVAKLAKIKKATVLEMVIEAIAAIGLPRKGASYPAIRKWIMVYKEVDPVRLKYFLRIAVKKGVDQGILVKPLKSASIGGARGYFMLPKTPKNPKISVKKPAMPLKKTRMSLQSNKSAPKTKTGKKTTKKLTNSTEDKNIVSNPPAKSPKKPVVEKKITTKQQKAKVEKKIIKKVNSKDKTGKKTVAKVPSKSEAEKKPVAKVPSKSEAEKKPKAKVPSKSEAGKKPKAKVSLKGKAGKKPATKVPLKAKAGKKAKDKMPSNDKSTELDENISRHSEAKYLFSESDENEINADVISEALEKENSEDLAKNTTVTVTEKKFKEQPKDKKRKVVKATKNLKSPDKTPVFQANSTRTVDNKKLYDSTEVELPRQEFSDTEINFKNKRINVLKSYSSDTELEVSKREEIKTKREVKKLPIRAKRNASKI